MIQGSTVRAVMGRDDIVVWPVTTANQLTSPSAITRCLIHCKRDGESDVIIDSADVPAAFVFNEQATVRGKLVNALKWMPGLAVGEQFTETAKWKCQVFLFDAVHTSGVDHGAFWLDVAFVVLPVVVIGNLIAATGCADTAFGFAESPDQFDYYPYCAGVRGSFSGDINAMLPSSGQTLTLYIAQSLTTGIFSVFMRGAFPGTSPVQSVFTNLTFVDKDGTPRNLSSASATYTPVSPARAHWEWDLGGVVMEDAGTYLLEFHE